jgi:OTU domain-containing protein 6
MASQVTQRPICVWQPTWRGMHHIITYGEELAAVPLHVLWSGAHYDSLLPRQSKL